MNVIRVGAVAVVMAVLQLAASSDASASPSPAPKTLSWAELSEIPLPPPGERIAYGGKAQQFGELRLPKGDGPFPVFIVIHGGCWQNAFDYRYMTHLAAWLTERGVATWTIEYRRLGDDGGGWPGTFLDVANATDALRSIAAKAPIDLTRVYATGHSAGGQLALWLPSRQKLAAADELYIANPLPVRGVLGLAAITDLAKYRIGPPKSCHASVEPLLGGAPDNVAARYAQTSPIERLPLGAQQVFIQGGKDAIVSPASVRVFVEAADRAGDNAVVLPLASLGHFESAVPLPSTEAVFEKALRLLLEG